MEGSSTGSAPNVYVTVNVTVAAPLPLEPHDVFHTPRAEVREPEETGPTSNSCDQLPFRPPRRPTYNNEEPRREEHYDDLRVYVVWKIAGSRAASGIHWGQGSDAYQGLIDLAGGCIGRLTFVRVKDRGSSSGIIPEAQRIWATRTSLGTCITPRIYRWH